MSVPNRFAKRLQLERKRRRKQEARLGSRREERPFPGTPHFDLPAGAKIVSSEAVGAVKMSEILPEFVEPFAHLVEGKGRDGYNRLLTIGVAAWNAAMVPREKRRAIIDKLVRDVFSEVGEEMQAAFRQMVDLLIERKEKRFAQYQRPILNFSLQDTGDGYSLQVMSGLT